jgi:hypothetical protein
LGLFMKVYSSLLNTALLFASVTAAMGDTMTVKYVMSNQSSKSHRLVIRTPKSIKTDGSGSPTVDSFHTVSIFLPAAKSGLIVQQQGETKVCTKGVFPFYVVDRRDFFVTGRTIVRPRAQHLSLSCHVGEDHKMTCSTAP